MSKVERLFPEVDLYIPARGDLVLQILYSSGKVSEKIILDADLEIVRNCHGWCYYHFDESSGAEIEWAQAVDCGFVEMHEHDICYDIGKASYSVIRKSFMPIVEKCIQNFRTS